MIKFFPPTVLFLFLFPLKTSGTSCFSDIFMGDRKRLIALKRVTNMEYVVH